MAERIPDQAAAAMRLFSRLFTAMLRAARHEARRRPTHHGLYPIALIMDGNGNVVCDDHGNPVVTLVPLTVADISDRTVSFEYAEQFASPKTVAALADVHVATINRAVREGQLPKPARISSRRVAHHLADVRHWIAQRTAAAK